MSGKTICHTDDIPPISLTRDMTCGPTMFVTAPAHCVINIEPYPKNSDNHLYEPSLTHKRSFHVTIQSNGNTITGTERPLADNMHYPSHFPNMTPDLLPPPYAQRGRYYDLNLIVNHESPCTVMVYEVPRTLHGLRARLTIQDIVILNGDTKHVWNVLGISCTPGSSFVTYLLHDDEALKDLYLRIPRKWTSEGISDEEAYAALLWDTMG